jgi:hypothetical protein
VLPVHFLEDTSLPKLILAKEQVFLLKAMFRNSAGVIRVGLGGVLLG